MRLGALRLPNAVPRVAAACLPAAGPLARPELPVLTPVPKPASGGTLRPQKRHVRRADVRRLTAGPVLLASGRRAASNRLTPRRGGPLPRAATGRTDRPLAPPQAVRRVRGARERLPYLSPLPFQASARKGKGN